MFHRRVKVTDDELYEQYIVKCRTLGGIAHDHGCSATTIRNRLVRANILDENGDII